MESIGDALYHFTSYATVNVHYEELCHDGQIPTFRMHWRASIDRSRSAGAASVSTNRYRIILTKIPP